MKNPKRIVVRAPNWIGDQVLAYPFFYSLRRAYPDAEITAVCVAWVESMQYRKQVDAVIELPRAVDTTLGARIRALNAAVEILRARSPQGWDLGFVLPPSFSGAWMFFRAGVACRVGYRGDGRSPLLTLAPRPRGSSTGRLHRAQEYLDLLGFADPQIKAGPGAQAFWPQQPNRELAEFKETELQPGVIQRFDYKHEWALKAALDPPREKYWILAPGSMAESRRWGLDQFVKLATIVHRETGLKGLIVGGPTEAPLAQQLIEHRGLGLADWTAQGAVPGLSLLFENAQFTVANDSGLAHVASLCGSPTCIVWGAGNPRHTSPLGPGRVRTVLSSPECWPCEKNVCSLEGDRRLQCLKQIGPEQVWEQIRDGLLTREEVR